mgnify:CR=1 FL=1
MPLLALAEFVFSEEGERAFQETQKRMEEELASIPGFLGYRPLALGDRRYLLLSLWEGEEALDRWVQNPFHRSVLMANFREWCLESWFAYGDTARPRVRRCRACGRWTRAEPGWDPHKPDRCVHCGRSWADS